MNICPVSYLKNLNVEVLKQELSGFIERVDKLFDHRI